MARIADLSFFRPDKNFIFVCMEEVRSWLNGDRDYFAGCKLYLKYGDDPVLTALFRKQDISRFKEERLLKAMIDIWRGGQVKATLPNAIVAPSNRKDEGWPKSRDKILSALRKQWEPLFKEMKTLHAQLLLIGSDEERGVAAHRILDLDDACDIIYAKRDHYLQYGRLPDEKEPDKVVDPAKYAVRLEAAKRYVRRYKNHLKKNPKNEKYAAKLKKYQAEVLFYKEKLKIDE